MNNKLFIGFIVAISVFSLSNSEFAFSSPLTQIERDGLVKVVYAGCVQQAPIGIDQSKLTYFCSCYTDEYIRNTSHEELASMLSPVGEPLKPKASHVDRRINQAIQKCSFQLQ